MPADVITQLEMAARVLDRVAPPVTVDELTSPVNVTSRSVAPREVPGAPATPATSPWPWRTVLVAAAALIVVVGGLAMLASRDTGEPGATAPPQPAPNATMPPTNLDPLAGGDVPVDGLPDDATLRFGAVLSDGSEIWVYDSASSAQVCFVRSVDDGHNTGCLDDGTYRAGLTWGLEGTGPSMLLWGLTPPSNPVTITIGDVAVASDLNGLWYTFPPVDATRFTITSATGSTDVEFPNPMIATTTIPSPPDASAIDSASTGLFGADTDPDVPLLYIPHPDVEPSYVQHVPALPHRTRALVQAPDGSTIAINLMENFWGQLPSEMDRRDIGGTVWATTLEDSNRGYVTLDDCSMLSIGTGPGRAAWDPNTRAVLDAVTFADPVTIDLPDQWQLLGIGPVGDWYSISFDPVIDGIPDVTLTQMPGSTIGPLLAEFAGRPITEITIDNGPAWQVTLDEAGWTQTIWQTDHVSMMLTSKGLTPEGIDRFLAQLSPAAPGDWDARYHDLDAGAVTFAEPACTPPALGIFTSGN